MQEENNQTDNNESMLHEITERVKTIDNRLRDLICYTEYIAANLDSSVDYAEFIGKQIEYRNRSQDLKRTESNPGNQTPSFQKFKKMRGAAL